MTKYKIRRIWLKARWYLYHVVLCYCEQTNNKFTLKPPPME